MPTPGPHRHGPPTPPNQTTPRCPQRSARTLRTLRSLSEPLSSWPGPLGPPDTANSDLVVSSPTWYIYWNESHPSSPRRGHFWISRAGLGAGLTLAPRKLHWDWNSWSEIHSPRSCHSTPARDHLGAWPSVLLFVYFLFSRLQRQVGETVLVHICHRGVENGVPGHFLCHIVT